MHAKSKHKKILDVGFEPGAGPEPRIKEVGLLGRIIENRKAEFYEPLGRTVRPNLTVRPKI